MQTNEAENKTPSGQINKESATGLHNSISTLLLWLNAKCIPTFLIVSGCIQTNYIYTGYNLDEDFKETTLSGCMAECQVALKCQFWSYTSKKCYLKSDRSAGTSSENSMSGTKECLGMITKIFALCHHLHLPVIIFKRAK